MLRRVLILDAGLIALLVIGGLKLKQDWKAFEPLHDPAAVKAGRLTLPPLPAVVTAQAATGDWTDIPTHNPFSFDRSDVDLVVAPPAPPPKPQGPKPILYGTMLIGKERTAVVASASNPASSRPMKTGETVDGWTIVEVAANSVQVESNGVRETVNTTDNIVQVQRTYEKTAITGSAPVVVSSPQPTPAPATPSAAPVTTVAPSQTTAPTGQPQKRCTPSPFGQICFDEPAKP